MEVRPSSERERWRRAARHDLHSVAEPLVDLRTGATLGHELLLRPRHPQTLRGWASGAGPAAGIELTHRALELAVSEMASRSCPIHMNVSPADLARWSFIGEVRTLVPRDLRSRLVLEVTEERPLLHGEVVRRSLDELRGDGVRFAVDDFGEGWSNLHSILLVRPDVLKVTTAVASPGGDQVLARWVVDLARSIGATSVLERIEDAEMAAWAKEIGFDLGQGWLWSDDARSR